MPGFRIQVNSSVWIEFLDKPPKTVEVLLTNPAICCHPFIVGELVVGDLGKRHELIKILKTIRKLQTITDEKVVDFIREKKLYGRGIGYIDCHLLASIYEARNTYVWTSDKRFRAAATELEVAFLPDKDYES